MPNLKGRWVFSYRDLIGRATRGDVRTMRHVLMSRTTTRAVSEALSLWRARLDEGMRDSWDKVLYPKDPCLTYEVNWDRLAKRRAASRLTS